MNLLTKEYATIFGLVFTALFFIAFTVSERYNAHKLKGGGIGSFLMNIIPTTSFDALARNDVLQVLFFAILFGVSLALVYLAKLRVGRHRVELPGGARPQ